MDVITIFPSRICGLMYQVLLIWRLHNERHEGVVQKGMEFAMELGLWAIIVEKNSWVEY